MIQASDLLPDKPLRTIPAYLSGHSLLVAYVMGCEGVPTPSIVVDDASDHAGRPRIGYGEMERWANTNGRLQRERVRKTGDLHLSQLVRAHGPAPTVKVAMYQSWNKCGHQIHGTHRQDVVSEFIKEMLT